jgi:alkanesulfonate monooxygenase SsuD/methylene tetrahydromethanopterin reductase-like flavin-dependent oxidoreductase (luciferase family)
MPLRFGVFLPAFGDFAEPDRLVELAVAVEEHGWDGLFLWDHLQAWPGLPVADAFVSAAAVAQATERIRIGMMVTPLARRRPWVFARQTVTLDRLSHGRLVVGVGLGDDGWGEFGSFAGELTDAVERGRALDESLELVEHFWSGEEVRHEGERFRVSAPAFLPRPVQDPLPVWVACVWPHRRPLARAARRAGCFPLLEQGDPPLLPDPAQVAEVRRELLALGAAEDVDIVCRGATGLVPPGELAPGLRACADAGMTWWLDSYAPAEPAEEVLDCVRAGPPSL